MMKSIIWILSATGLACAQLSGQTTLAGWTFEAGSVSSLPATVPAPSGGFLSANVGSGTATAVHASGDSLWFSSGGNGSNRGFAGTTWANGDYFQFSISTTGYSSITITWDQYSPSDGPRDFRLSYSMNGTNFTNSTTFTMSDSPTWNTSTPQTGTATNFSIDLSAVSALANANSVYFRLTNSSAAAVNGGAVGYYSYTVLDNFTISGTAIPEPASMAFLASLLSFLSMLGWRRFRVSSLS